MRVQVFVAAAIFLTGCASQGTSQSLSNQVNKPELVGVVVVEGQEIAMTKGVVDIIEKEDHVDTSDDRVRCIREKRTGTHRTIRTCRTVSEIEAQARKSKEALDRLQRRGKINVGN